MNFFEQGIPLGRWFKITVTLHWTFVIYAVFRVMDSPTPGIDALFMGLLFLTVLLHEFGHALSCKALGGVALHIVLWPLGGIAFVQPPGTAWAYLITTVCGPLVNAILWPLFLIIGNYGLPFLAQHMDTHSMAFTILEATCYAMIEINRWLLIFNLIPCYPMDGGRILQEILWIVLGLRRSLQIAGMLGTVIGCGFIVLGLGLYEIHIPVADIRLGHDYNFLLAVIGLMCAMQSFGIYRRSQEIGTWRKN